MREKQRANTFEEALDGAKEQVQNVMAANLEGTLGDEDLAQEAADQLVGDDAYDNVNPAAISVEAVHTINDKGYEAAFAECGFWKEYTEQGMARDDGSPSLADAVKECRAASDGLSQVGHEQEHGAADVEH